MYAIVTTVSSHRIRYAIPVEDLIKEGTTLTPTQDQLIEWAEDLVTMNEVKEFSQDWLGEQIIDVDIIDQETTINKFDKDNPYLNRWSKNLKLAFLNYWKENDEDQKSHYEEMRQNFQKEKVTPNAE